jgi:hypothetical protein
MLNMCDGALNFEVPVLDDLIWRRAVDTSLDAPNDVVAREAQEEVLESHYCVAARSVVVLEGR